jgi:manganese oxidase
MWGPSQGPCAGIVCPASNRCATIAAMTAAAQSEDSAQSPANASEVPASVTEELTGKNRTYYLAADQVNWTYASSEINDITGKPYEGMAKEFVEPGPDRIGNTYLKAQYREYTDETFTDLKPIPQEWQHLGILGSVIREEVGDTIEVVFKNNLNFSVSLHPHGVFYLKDSEGAPYNDGTSGQNKNDDSVQLGDMHTYVWQVPERAGPGPNDPSSIVWPYHSHVNETSDENAGLIGPIIITRQGMANPDGSPEDVDREFVTLFTFFDENMSSFLKQNMETFVGNISSSVNQMDSMPMGNIMSTQKH